MPVALIRSRWTSGALEFYDPATDTVVMSIATTGVNIPTFTIDSLVLDAGATVDLNGIADSFILDADGDTTISAPTDDQIDIEVSGADDFTITANSFNVLSGSVINFADAADAQFGTGDDAAVRWSTSDADNHSLVVALGDSNQALHLTDLAAVATDWNVAADTHPTLYAHSNTTPATDYMTFGAHDGTTGHINLVGGTTISFDVAGTPEVTMTASGIVLASGNSLAGEVVSFNGITGANEISLVTNLADSLSVKDSAGDLIVFNTTTGSQAITITPATTITGLVTATAGVVVGSSGVLDANGVADAIVIDADGDTTISAPTDDQIDIEIAGADDFQFTANAFTALSGSAIATNTINETTAESGVTIDSVLLKDGEVTGGVTMDDGDLLFVKGAGTGTGDVVARFGGVATEGLELRVYDATVAPGAVETNLINIPAGSVILSVQGNVETALTGGSTTVTWSIGLTGDPDKYGTAGYPSASDALTKNSKSDWMGTWAYLTSSEQLVLTGAATGGAADGDTALTVGTVRVRVVYFATNSLVDAA